MMMVIPGWDVAVQANWGFVRVRWLSHAAVGILIPLQFCTILQIELIETIDWHVCMFGWFGCRFTPTLSKAVSVQDGHLFGYHEWLGCSNWNHFSPNDKKLYEFNFFSLNVSNFMRNSNPLGTGRLIILLFVVSAAFNCFAVFHWVLQEDDGQICINLSSCGTTFSQVGICWNSNMFSHMEDLLKSLWMAQWLSLRRMQELLEVQQWGAVSIDFWPVGYVFGLLCAAR